LYYLLFPSFADENNITNLDDFIQNIKNELKNVDAIAIASEKLASALKNKGFNTYYIPQFTNTEKFYPDYDNDKKSEVLFVGNYLSYRTAVPTTLAAGLPLTVYGNGWQKGIAKAPYIDNRILRKYYSSAKIVLNDTREGMKKFGFIINRIFDATACETLVISDYMPEIEKIYGDTVPMWKTEQELVDLIKYYLAPEHEEERKDKARRAREITLKNFTAEIVAKKFQDIITTIKQQKGL
jgi:spore maturation protein CgeB